MKYSCSIGQIARADCELLDAERTLASSSIMLLSLFAWFTCACACTARAAPAQCPENLAIFCRMYAGYLRHLQTESIREQKRHSLLHSGCNAVFLKQKGIAIDALGKLSGALNPARSKAFSGNKGTLP